jgi:hypothetical protein
MKEPYLAFCCQIDDSVLERSPVYRITASKEMKMLEFSMVAWLHSPVSDGKSKKFLGRDPENGRPIDWLLILAERTLPTATA